MTPLIPRQLARRITPAIAVNAALAAALLAAGATGDAARLATGPEPEPAGNAEAMPPATPDEEGGTGEERERERTRMPQESNSPSTMTPSEEPDAALAQEISGLLDGTSGPPMAYGARLSVSVLAVETGVTARYGGESFDTASIVKVDILAALLLRAQDEGRELTAQERTLAEQMITASDNEAADALWTEIGGQAGLDAANARLGLTETQGGDGATWGLTQTTSADQIALLRAVYGYVSDPVLEADSRAYVRQLMDSVIAEQQWGVSAAAEGDFELKNGWLPRSQTELWDVNSIGRVTVDGTSYLVAVVSDGHVTLADGIAWVEAAARAAVGAVSGR